MLKHLGKERTEILMSQCSEEHSGNYVRKNPMCFLKSVHMMELKTFILLKDLVIMERSGMAEYQFLNWTETTAEL